MSQTLRGVLKKLSVSCVVRYLPLTTRKHDLVAHAVLKFCAQGVSHKADIQSNKTEKGRYLVKRKKESWLLYAQQIPYGKYLSGSGDSIFFQDVFSRYLRFSLVSL